MNWKFWQPPVPECVHKWTQWYEIETLQGNWTVIIKQARKCTLCNYTNVDITRKSV